MEQKKVSDTDHSGDEVIEPGRNKGELNDPSGTDPERGPEPVEGRSEGTKREKEKVKMKEQ